MHEHPYIFPISTRSYAFLSPSCFPKQSVLHSTPSHTLLHRRPHPPASRTCAWTSTSQLPPPIHTMSARGITSLTPSHINKNNSTSTNNINNNINPHSINPMMNVNAHLLNNNNNISNPNPANLTPMDANNSKFFHLFQPNDPQQPITTAPSTAPNSNTNLYLNLNKHLNASTSSNTVYNASEFWANNTPPSSQATNNINNNSSYIPERPTSASNLILINQQAQASLSAPPSSQRHSTPHVFGSNPSSILNLNIHPNNPQNLKHQSSPNLWSNASANTNSNIGVYSATSLDDPLGPSSLSDSSTSIPVSSDASLSAPPSASNSNSFNFSRSSRFFPSPMFESKNSLESPNNSSNNIFNQSPLLSNNNNRRTTIPTSSASLTHSPSFLASPNSASKIPTSFDLNLRSNSTGYQIPQHLNLNYNTSSTSTPQHDSSNINYFDTNNNLSYSTLFGDNNSSTILSQQFTNMSSSPIHSNLDNKSPSLHPSSHNIANHYQLSYHVNNNFDNNQNSNILPTSSFVDKDLTIDKADFDINDINDLSELSFLRTSQNESPSPSPNSSPKKSLKEQPSKSKSKSKQKQPSSNKDKLTYAVPYLQQPIPSPLSASSYSVPTPTLNLSNLKNRIPSIESPHTPLNQQSISQLLTVTLQNNLENDNTKEDDVIVDNTDDSNVFNDNRYDDDNNVSYTSPSSSSFPSPSLPTIPLFVGKPKQDVVNTDNITTKSRILHYIHHVITRHNIAYKTYLVSVPSNTPIDVVSNLIETVFYPLGIIKSVKRINNYDIENPSTTESSTPVIDTTLFTRFRVIMAVADSSLTTYSTPSSFNTSSNNYPRHGGKFNNNNSDKEVQTTQQQQSQQPQHIGPWKSIRYTIDSRDVKMLIFYEGEQDEIIDEDIIDDDLKALNKKTSNDEIIESVRLNAKSSMSKSLTTNNKLDVCWYPEGFSSTFHRRGVNNFMFVRELQSKMIVNRTRVSGGGIVEMGEFRLSVPIEEIGYSGESSTNTNNTTNGGERLKRSFLVNIDLKELDGKVNPNLGSNNGGNSKKNKDNKDNNNSNNGSNALINSNSENIGNNSHSTEIDKGTCSSTTSSNSNSHSNSGGNNERTGHGHSHNNHNHTHNYNNNSNNSNYGYNNHNHNHSHSNYNHNNNHNHNNHNYIHNNNNRESQSQSSTTLMTPSSSTVTSVSESNNDTNSSINGNSSGRGKFGKKRGESRGGFHYSRRGGNTRGGFRGK